MQKIIKGIFKKSYLITLFISSLFGKSSYAQIINLDGFWQCSIDYECSWGWKDDRSSLLLTKQFGSTFHGMIFGGDIEISAWNTDEHDFEIKGQNGCIRKGRLKKREFAGRIYLSGSWIAEGGNNAMWGTGLCCNGKIELYRDIEKGKQDSIIKNKKKNENGVTYNEQALKNQHIKLVAGTKFILKNVLFKLSSDELMPEAYSELEFLANVLKEDKVRIVRLEGHTDIDGPHHKNKQLSKKRVKTIKNYLIEKGVDKNRIKLKWYGDKKPILKLGTVEQRKINRRVEVRVLK